MRILQVALLIVFIACSSPSEKTPTESSVQEDDTSTASVENSDPGVGEKVYSQFCIVCHMADGKGIAGLNPPLINSDWVKGDKVKLIKIVLEGSKGGQYPVNGETFTNVMTSHAFLSDDEIAGVLTYIRSNFENNSGAISADEVAEVRSTMD